MAGKTKEEGFVPKYARLREHLRARISQMEPGQALPVIAKIRSEYKVSQPTVDRAIQELRTEGLLISRRGSGVYVSEMVGIQRIGMVFYRDIFSADIPVFFRNLLASFQGLCRGNGKLLSYYIDDTHYDRNEHGPSRLQLDVRSGQLDGLIVISSPTPEYSENFAALGIPLETWTQIDCPQRVCGDYNAVVKLGTESLVAQGCRRIALWYSNIGSMGRAQMAAFHEVLACSPACTHPRWIINADIENTPLDLAGYTQFKQIWKSWDEKPDGIVCTDDNYTTGLLHAADTMSIKIPGDLKVATHANKGLDKPSPSRVTRIEFDWNEVAIAMLKRLELRISNVPNPMQHRAPVIAMLKRLELRISGQTPKPDILKISPHFQKQNQRENH